MIELQIDKMKPMVLVENRAQSIDLTGYVLTTIRERLDHQVGKRVLSSIHVDCGCVLGCGSQAPAEFVTGALVKFDCPHQGKPHPPGPA